MQWRLTVLEMNDIEMESVSGGYEYTWSIRPGFTINWRSYSGGGYEVWGGGERVLSPRRYQDLSAQEKALIEADPAQWTSVIYGLPYV